MAERQGSAARSRGGRRILQVAYVAWRVRKALGLDKVPAGVTDKANDAIIYDVDATGKSGSGYGHPKCGHSEDAVAKEIGSSAAGPK